MVELGAHNSEVRDVDFCFGIVGFLGFEALRWYKCMWTRRKVSPTRYAFLYPLTLIVVAAFSGAVAYAMAGKNLGRALYIGFSVPTSIKAVLAPPKVGSAVDPDDIEVRPATSLDVLSAWTKRYFDF